MVRAKKITRSSNKARKENESSENALGQSKTSDLVQVDVEPPKAAVQGEEKVEISLDQAASGNDEETHNLEIKNAITVDNDENEMMTEINDDNLAEEDLNSSEEDEIYSEESSCEEDEENFEEVEEDSFDQDEENVDLQTGENESEEDNVEIENEVKKKENTEKEKEMTNGDEKNTQEPVTEKVDVSRKKAQPTSSKKLKSTDEHKPESSRKRKAKERVESMGMIFMCSSITKEDCFRYSVLGLPASKKDTVEKIYPGMRLFLYDVDLKLLNGIYKAAGPGGYNIEPKAFKSQFPSQVRFRVLKDCLPLAEERFKKVIKENYFSKNKFDCKLTSLQVNKLCKLFLAKSRGQRLTKLGRSRKAENYTTVRTGKVRIRRAEEDRFHSVREERKYRDRPQKRQRRVPVSSVREPPPLRGRSPLPSFSRLYAHDRTLEEDPYRKYPYLEIRDPYRDGLLLRHGDSYRDRRDSPLEQRGSYRDGRDPFIERRDSYRDAREQRDFYGVRRDPPTERHDPNRDGRDIQLGRPSPYRDGQRAYINRHDPYDDRRDSYLLHRSPPRAIASEPRITYRRDPLSDHRDVYRDDRLFETGDSYGRKLLLDHLDLQPPIESRRLDRISSRDSYVSYRARPSYMEPTYSAEYPSRAGLEHDLRPSTDHRTARGQLSGYYSRRS